MGGGSGGGGNSTTVQKADPWEGVQPHLLNAYQRLNQLYSPGQGPQYYPGSTVAQPNPLEYMGVNQQLAGINGMQNVANGAAGALHQMGGNATTQSDVGAVMANQGGQGMLNLANAQGWSTGTANSAAQNLAANGGYLTAQGTDQANNAMNRLYAAGDPANNPYFQSAVQTAIRPVTEQFTEQVLPGIRAGAQDAGQFGGSRQGIAEGLAARGYQNTVGDITANMGNAAYAQGLNAVNSAGNLGSNMAQMGLGATSGAGALGAQMAGLQGNLYGNYGSLGQNMNATGLQSLGQMAALSGGVQQGLAFPGQLTQQLGQSQTAIDQSMLDANVDRWNYNQNLPYSMIQDYMTALNGGAMLGGTQQSRASGGGGSRGAGVLGGAVSGGALGSMIAGASSGAIGGPMGIGVGAGLGALFGLF